MPDTPLGRDSIRFGPFQLDPRTREVRRDGRVIPMQRKAFEFLAAIAERRGDVVTREELRRRLWPDEEYGSFNDGLNTAARKVRRALDDSADEPRFIETVPGVGYRLLVPVELEPRSPQAKGDEGVRPLAPTSVPGLLIGRTRAIALAATVAVLVLASVMSLRPMQASTRDSVHFRLTAPRGMSFPPGGPAAAISPLGDRVAYVAVTEKPLDSGRICIYDVATGTATPVAGTEGANQPFWSPDGKSLGFVFYSRLRILDLATGLVRDLGDATDASGASWNSHDEILVGSVHGPVSRIDTESGQRTFVTRVDSASGEVGHTFPLLLPDERSFLYMAIARDPAANALYLAQLGDTVRHRILTTPHAPAFVEPRWLVYPLNGAVVRQEFDWRRRTLGKTVVEAQDTVETLDATGMSGLSTSASGALAHWPRKPDPISELVWLDRDGRPLGKVASPDVWRDVELSPDERSLLIERYDGRERAPELWVIDLTGGTRTRMTFNPGNDESGVWSSDGTRFVYARHRGIQQVSDLFLGYRGDPHRSEPLLVDGASVHPSDWSRDDRFVLYERPDSQGRANVWWLEIGSKRAPTEWLKEAHDERHARFSPDGRWVAYESNETGRNEIYIRKFLSHDRSIRVSASGGQHPRWRADGKELFFLSSEDKLMAAAIRPGARSAEVGVPTAVIDLKRWLPPGNRNLRYDVTADGRRILVSAPIDPPKEWAVTVVLNAPAKWAK